MISYDCERMHRPCSAIFQKHIILKIWQCAISTGHSYTPAATQHALCSVWKYLKLKNDYL